MAERAHAVGRPRAPKFPPGLTWFNTPAPLQFGEALQGRVVLLDFWTFCCINCLHVMPDLEALEARYHDDPVAIIGVHSPKYTHEANPASVREAILRYDVHHPVVVDADHTVWDAFAARAWPTLVVVDPQGYIAAVLSGEGHRDELIGIIDGLLAHGRQTGTLADGPVPVKREIPHLVISPLAFPGKVLADRAGARLFIADTAHHRIIVTDWNGHVTGYFGSGRRGNVDGPFGDVRFNGPQGMALVGEGLYIADTGNHMVRRADLRSFHVDTVLGDGTIGYDRRGGQAGRKQRLNSPWDLAYLDGTLYIAMAGLHQLWAFNPTTRVGQPVAGTGRESLADGPARRAALAQPSGLSATDRVLYFADSETSAIRCYDPATEQITSLIGEGLFTFGDVDGPLEAALLQHPLGVAAGRDDLYLTDSYNHKIKRIDLRRGTVTTVAGTGRPGRSEGGRLALSEPGGLSYSGNDLFIADTNNDRVIHLRPDTGEWRELVLKINGQPLE